MIFFFFCFIWSCSCPAKQQCTCGFISVYLLILPCFCFSINVAFIDHQSIKLQSLKRVVRVSGSRIFFFEGRSFISDIVCPLSHLQVFVNAHPPPPPNQLLARPFGETISMALKHTDVIHLIKCSRLHLQIHQSLPCPAFSGCVTVSVCGTDPSLLFLLFLFCP